MILSLKDVFGGLRNTSLILKWCEIFWCNITTFFLTCTNSIFINHDVSVALHKSIVGQTQLPYGSIRYTDNLKLKRSGQHPVLIGRVEWTVDVGQLLLKSKYERVIEKTVLKVYTYIIVFWVLLGAPTIFLVHPTIKGNSQNTLSAFFFLLSFFLQ